MTFMFQKVNRVYKSFSAGLRDVLGAMASDMKGTFQALSEAFKEHSMLNIVAARGGRKLLIRVYLQTRD